MKSLKYIISNIYQSTDCFCDDIENNELYNSALNLIFFNESLCKFDDIDLFLTGGESYIFYEKL